MTIKIQAYQKYGRKTRTVQDEYQFCCWGKLYRWLEGFASLNKCSECEEKDNIDYKVKSIKEIIENIREDPKAMKKVRELLK